MDSRNLQREIQDIMNELADRRNTKAGSEHARMLSIAITHLETAELYIRETEQPRKTG